MNDLALFMQKTRLRIIVVVLVLGAVFLFACSTAEKWGTKYDVLLDRSDVDVAYSITNDGGETRRFTLPGPVFVTEERIGDEYAVFAIDNSGLGAVRCVWEIYATTSFYMERCEALGNPELVTKLNGALG